MSFFSVFLILLNLYFFFSYDFKKIFKLLIVESILIKLLCDIGVGINLPFIGLKPYELLYYSLFICSIYILLKNKLTNSQKKIFYFFIGCILINNILLIINPLSYKSVCLPGLWYDYFTNNISSSPSFGKYVIIYDFYFIIAFIVICAIKNFLSKEEIITLLNKILKYSFLILISIISLEIIIKLSMGEIVFYQFRDLIFGLGSDTSSILNRGGLTAIYGFCTEPSSLSLSLFYIGLASILVIREYKHLFIAFTIILVIGVLTGSMLFYVLFLLLILALFVKEYTNIFCFLKRKNKLIICFFLVFLIMLRFFLQSNLGSYFINRILNVFSIFLNGNIAFNSESVRIYSSLDMLRVFVYRPLFGAGLGTTYGFSSLFSFLSNFGIIGVISYFTVWKNFIGKFKYRNLLFLIVPLFVSFIIHGSINTFVFPQYLLILLMIYYANNVLFID